MILLFSPTVISNPVYLGITMDRTLSYQEHLRKVAEKIESCNNLLMKVLDPAEMQMPIICEYQHWPCATRLQSFVAQSDRALPTRTLSMHNCILAPGEQ